MSLGVYGFFSPFYHSNLLSLLCLRRRGISLNGGNHPLDGSCGRSLLVAERAIRAERVAWGLLEVRSEYFFGTVLDSLPHELHDPRCPTLDSDRGLRRLLRGADADICG
jgi:hypothetical protein